MPAKSSVRVSANTNPAVNDKIRRDTEKSIAYYVAHRAEIGKRLQELDEEWDIERTLETAASTFSLVGLTLGIVRSRKFLLIPLVVQSFFLQHALQGWCPPLPVLRKLGVRTQNEIDIEKYALKALRGDFKELPADAKSRGTAPVLDAVRK